MPNIKTIADGGPNPNTPSVKEMRDSQAAGATGKGTALQTYPELQADFNMGIDSEDNDGEQE